MQIGYMQKKRNQKGPFFKLVVMVNTPLNIRYYIEKDRFD
jgi:hypothetical protein